jgi:hypothetical protein
MGVGQLCASTAAPLVVCLKEIDCDDRSRRHIHLGSKGPHRFIDDTQDNVGTLRIGL